MAEETRGGGGTKARLLHFGRWFSLGEVSIAVFQ